MDKTCDLPSCSNTTGDIKKCSLNQLSVGCCGMVTHVDGDRDLKRRLLEMGFCNGAAVEVVRRAPLGDPIEFRLRGYYLSLRGEQAKYVQVNVTR
jgi:ferrous iron transport protein A